MRNVVTSGLGQGSVVIEASMTSGARLQARLAIEHGKHAFLLQSLIEEHDWARKFAKREGAIVIEDINDALGHLRRPEELTAEWQHEHEGARATRVQAPTFVASRLAAAPLQGQQRLSF